jgi:hypothetical protein
MQWVHPQCLIDTVKAYSQGYVNDFIVAGFGSGHRVALRLPRSGEWRYLSEMHVFFHGRGDPLIYEWSQNASFSWQVHSDSGGLPGTATSPVIDWPINDSTKLIRGEWFIGEIGAWIPDSATGDTWIVGAWGDSAIGLVAIGSEPSASSLETLVKMDGSDWFPLNQRALLVEFVFLASGLESFASVSVETSSYSSSPTDFITIRELMSGPYAPRSDSQGVACGAPLVWEDNQVVADQVVRYGVAVACSTGTAATVWTPPLTVPGFESLTIEPPVLSASVPENQDTVLVFDVSNTGLSALSLVLESGELRRDGGTAEPDSALMPMNMIPDTLMVPGFGTHVVRVELESSRYKPGDYHGGLVFRVSDELDSLQRRHAVAVDLRVDSQTGVTEEDSSTGGFPGSVAAGFWDVQPLANPFRDEIALRIAPKQPLTSRHGDASQSLRGQEGEIEFAVYDIRGRKWREGAVNATALNEDTPAFLRINGTGGWSSGVYICRIRIGDHVRSVKLIHVK